MDWGLGVSRFEPIDTRFFSPQTPVCIVDYGDPAEAGLARDLLEGLGAVPLLHRPGTPDDFLLVLGQEADAPPFLLLCGHGDEICFVFGAYGPDIDPSALVGASTPPAAIAHRVRLTGSVVVSTGCLTGRAAMGQAFLRGRVRAYIAPDGYPSGPDALLLVAHFFHRCLGHGNGWEEAWQHAAAYDTASQLFVIHTDDGVRRHRGDRRLV